MVYKSAVGKSGVVVGQFQALHVGPGSEAIQVGIQPICPQRNPVPEHGAHRVARFARNQGVNSPGAHHVPGRHLAAVFVALVAVGLVAVHGSQDFANALVAFFGARRGGIQPCNMVRRFVAVGVLTDKPGNVGLFAPDGR